MKIQADQSYLQVGSPPRGMREVHGAEENRKGTAVMPCGRDTVVLSPQARQLKSAREVYDALPDVRADKVSQLKEQVMNGTYEVHTGRIAFKMLQESLLAERG